MGYNVSTYLLPKNAYFLEAEPLEIVEHSKDLVYTTYDIPFFWIETITTNEEELSIFWKGENKYCISKFSYEVKNNATSKATSNIEIDLNPIVVTELHPCQSYTVNLTALDVQNVEVQCKKEKSCFQSAEMKYKHPEGLSNVSVVNESGATVKVTWNNPEDVFCVKNYTIFYKIVDSKDWQTEEIKDQVASEYLFYGVSGCEKYLFDVQLNIDMKTFNVTELNITAQEFQAPVITPEDNLELGLEDEVNADKTITAILTWQQPKNHSKCVKHFIVEMLSLEGEQQFNETLDSSRVSYVFEELYPCNAYKFTVTPLTEHDLGVQSVLNKTLQEVSKYRLICF